MAEEASCWSSAEKPGTIYDALKMNGLPIGLLPKNVKNYTIDEEWSFEVHLDEPCYAKFENQVCYDTNIKGTISYGQIGNLSGIVAQDLFLWFPVKGIHVDVPSSGLIYFDICFPRLYQENSGLRVTILQQKPFSSPRKIPDVQIILW
ncbi:hypothetical protein SUGI_0546490 [Cryptomeria japonica]|nr:hypothetical protein SUGI_0546490 [Cryptomeria japonica]